MLALVAIGENLKRWSERVKRDAVTLWFAARHPATPWYAKAMGAFVVAYALSPIDLIPDFIPVLGYVDDVLLLPALIWLTIRLLPSPILDECRHLADNWLKTRGTKPSSRIGAIVIVSIWIAVGAALWLWIVQPRIQHLATAFSSTNAAGAGSLASKPALKPAASPWRAAATAGRSHFDPGRPGRCELR